MRRVGRNRSELLTAGAELLRSPRTEQPGVAAGLRLESAVSVGRRLERSGGFGPGCGSD